jgi:glycerate kinase
MRDVDWLIAPDSFKGTYAAREVALAGKAVSEIAARCANAGVPLHVVARSVALDTAQAEPLGLASTRQASDLAELEDAGRALAAAAISA